MSKLVELLNHDMIKTAAETDPSLIASEPYVRGRVDALNAALTVLPAHDAEIREQAKREQMEADIALISGIEIGSYTIPEEIRLDLTGRNLETLVAIMERGWDGCKEFAVAQLRAAYAKAHRESWTKEAEHAE